MKQFKDIKNPKLEQGHCSLQQSLKFQKRPSEATSRSSSCLFLDHSCQLHCGHSSQAPEESLFNFVTVQHIFTEQCSRSLWWNFVLEYHFGTLIWKIMMEGCSETSLLRNMVLDRHLQTLLQKIIMDRFAVRLFFFLQKTITVDLELVWKTTMELCSR